MSPIYSICDLFAMSEPLELYPVQFPSWTPDDIFLVYHDNWMVRRPRNSARDYGHWVMSQPVRVDCVTAPSRSTGYEDLVRFFVDLHKVYASNFSREYKEWYDAGHQ